MKFIKRSVGEKFRIIRSGVIAEDMFAYRWLSSTQQRENGHTTKQKDYFWNVTLHIVRKRYVLLLPRDFLKLSFTHRGFFFLAKRQSREVNKNIPTHFYFCCCE